MKLKPRFYLIGLLVAFLEEFITQGVLKRSLLVWIIPAIIAFLPFLVVVRFIDKILQKRMREHRTALAYYAIAGGIGLMIEWFIIGLSPWSSPGADPVLTVIFHVGIFSFWGSVALAPRLLLDKEGSVVGVRKWYRRFLVFGFLFVYFITFSASRETQFLAGVVSVLLMFISLNFFYFRYIRTLSNRI